MVTAKLGTDISEISDVDDLLRVARRAQVDGGPLVLEFEGGVVAHVEAGSGVDDEDDWPELTEEDEAAFLASAGSWAGLIDGEALKRQIRAGRGHVDA